MPISDIKARSLEERMAKVGLKEADIQEHFVRSGGSGGQNVNKTSTCVALKHLPSGIEVKCQIDRSQAVNRFLARRILLEKLEKKVFGAKSEARKKIWKLRKQKKRRSKKAKEKVLREKHLRSEKKAARRNIFD